ncbi:MAG: hypothetical protein K2M94_02900 [Paramuribaculum sp.]|nr:hypothetical protein [Paramuribaculum sp.]
MACCIASFYDIRWALVLVMIIFLVIPFIIFHIYYSKLLTPEAQYMISPKSCSIIPDEYIIITFHSADNEHTPLNHQSIPWAQIKRISSTRKLLLIHVLGSSIPLIIPLDAFPAPQQALNLVTPETY